MSSSNKKTDDNIIVGLNSVGLSLGRIARDLDIHHTTVTHRLKTLQIEPADTRRAFMENIYDRLSVAQRQWLINQLGAGNDIKDYIYSLIVKEFISKNN